MTGAEAVSVRRRSSRNSSMLSAVTVENLLGAVDRHIERVILSGVDASSVAEGPWRSEIAHAIPGIARPILSSTIESVRHVGQHLEARIRFVSVASVLVVETLWQVSVESGLRMISANPEMVHRIDSTTARVGRKDFRTRIKQPA